MDAKAKKTKMICIICPVGCEIEANVSVDSNKIVDIRGFKCSKGKDYAFSEIFDPRRTLITVVRVKGGQLPVVSVKTTKLISKNRLFDAVKALSKIEVEAPVKAGDIIVENLLDMGVPVVATNNVRKD